MRLHLILSHKFNVCIIHVTPHEIHIEIQDDFARNMVFPLYLYILLYFHPCVCNPDVLTYDCFLHQETLLIGIDRNPWLMKRICVVPTMHRSTMGF
jgi:hypothetical protein